MLLDDIAESTTSSRHKFLGPLCGLTTAFFKVTRKPPSSSSRIPSIALFQVAHLQVSGHIDGSSIVADSIKCQ
jgi:hypothetical protein